MTLYIDWASVGSFITNTFRYLTDIEFTVLGGTVSLWDIVIYSVLLAGSGWMISVFLGGGGDD